MSQPTEQTRLLLRQTSQPEYMFDYNMTRDRKRRIRQFQCCLCSTVLSLFLVSVVITVIYSINEEFPDNSTMAQNVSDINIERPVLVLLSRSLPLSDIKPQNKSLEDETLWREAYEEGRAKLIEKDRIESTIPSLNLQSPSYKHQRVTSTSSKGRNLARVGFIQEYATRYMHRNKTNTILIEKFCPSTTPSFNEHCNNIKVECNTFQKYRSYNGSCNNMKNPEFGLAYTSFRRMLLPDYADGIGKPRISKTGKPLPSARTVSLVVHRAYNKDDPKFTVMLAVWGQFLDHDITSTALSQKSNGSSLSCCHISGNTSPECFPVNLDEEDPFRIYNVSCIEFVRSAPAPTCCLGPREQMNQVTAFIDGSAMYGIDEESVKKLRSFENGTMKVFVTADGRILLPMSEDMTDGCNREEEEKKGRYCFLAGDIRANENLNLVSMHLLWVRHHNRIALILSKINPHWNDEKTFQETRRIIAAQMQHITYNEFLPILLGGRLMKKMNLLPMKRGYFKKYNESVDPSIANSFATAAFRFAHSIIPSLMKLLANDTSTPEYVQMRKMLFNPFNLYKKGELDKTIRGTMNTTIQASDAYFTDELKTHMFESRTEKENQSKQCGLDLVSLNIQRGRDHGLPGYVHWRHHCQLKKAKNFADLKDELDSDSFHNMQVIYREVEDIDLYTGALSENPIERSLLGPTITCLILDQFYRIKYGDKFWYENSKKPQSFSSEQLNELRKTSLANIICHSADEIQVIQKRVMEKAGPKNNYVNCSVLESPNLELWRENLSHLGMSTGEGIYLSAISPAT